MIAKTRRGIWAVAVIVITYAASVGAVRLIEQRQLYVPGTDRTLVAPRNGLELPVKRVELLTRDSVTLVGWVIPAERAQSTDTAPWILICKGNKGNIAAPARLQHYAALRQLGLNILALDYRGYGEGTGRSTEIDRVRTPKLFLHATADENIPIAHGRRLYERAAPPKRFIELRGGHGNAFKADSTKYFGSILEFALEVTRPNYRADR
jgi:hypothetical protein